MLAPPVAPYVSEPRANRPSRALKRVHSDGHDSVNIIIAPEGTSAMDTLHPGGAQAGSCQAAMTYWTAKYRPEARITARNVCANRFIIFYNSAEIRYPQKNLLTEFVILYYIWMF